MSRFERFGAKLGVVLALAGFVMIFLGWNGAASVDRLPAQFPYLISGGIAGLGLVIFGAILVAVDTRREGEQRLEAMVAELRDAVARLAPPEEEALEGTGPMVVIGQTSYHRPDCNLLEGRDDLPQIGRDAAIARDLIACRICEPGPSAPAPSRPARKGRRPRTRGKVGPR